MRVFDFDDYKGFLKALISENEGTKGFRARLAEAAGCQKSFLSQVLNGSIHLTPDHAAKISVFLNLDETESDYLLGILDYARAGSEQLRNLLRTRLDRHKRRYDDISQNWEQEKIRGFEAEAIYYSSWYFSAIHILISIPGYTSAKSIAERLSLPEPVVQDALHTLHRIGAITNLDGHWKIGDQTVHLAKTSIMAESHHSGWRQRAILDCQKKESWSVHYSSVFSISTKDADRFREQLLEFVLTSRSLISTSLEEDLCCFTTDLFRV